MLDHKISVYFVNWRTIDLLNLYDYHDLFALIVSFAFLYLSSFYMPAGLSFGISAMMSLYGTLLLDEIMQAKEVIRPSNVVVIN